MRYLSVEYIRSALNRGKSVSQWLPPRSKGEQTILRWVSLEPTGDGLTLQNASRSEAKCF
jgi:hypothetical protein